MPEERRMQLMLSSNSAVGGGNYLSYSDGVLAGNNMPNGILFTFNGISQQWLNERAEHTTWYYNLLYDPQSINGYAQILVAKKSAGTDISEPGTISIITPFSQQPLYPTSYSDIITMKIIFETADYEISMNESIELSGSFLIDPVIEDLPFFMFPKYIGEAPVSSYSKKFFFESASYEYIY